MTVNLDYRPPLFISSELNSVVFRNGHAYTIALNHNPRVYGIPPPRLFELSVQRETVEALPVRYVSDDLL